ncbi:MAG TPA: pyrimidine dimer DNA glycosylase/endonuclease V [Miltoncostaeaceae bacterium]|mgnify:CR=1 FL=1|nr:pyrimidine dimer DNA glycosylase/endonuclease V [Miltoncostaeaceae bacterium]
MHPRFLDRQGLVACWREALLAQAVLAGRTRGYTRHPQLERFRETPDPLELIGGYLVGLAAEAGTRGYRFDRDKVLRWSEPTPRMAVTDGQLEHEWAHLGAKLAGRSPDDAKRWRAAAPEAHPLLRVVSGPIEAWERVGEHPSDR